MHLSLKINPRMVAAIGSSPSIPILPVSIEVKDVPQYFRLQRAAPGEESVPTHGNIAQSHSETFIVTRLGSREPHVRASYQHLQVQENVPWNKLGARIRGVQGEVVGDEVSPSDPVTRILFHRSGVDGQARGAQNTCVNVRGTYDGVNVEGSCRIQLPLDVCVVELLFSPSWFSLSTLPLNVTLTYMVSDDCKSMGEVSEVAGSVRVVSVGTPRIQQVSVGDSVTISLPDKTLLPGEVFTASINLRQNWTQPSFSLRVRCRTGLELLFARSAAPNTWAIKTEMQKGAKHHTVIGHVTHRGASERRPLPAVALLDFLVSNISVGSAVSRRITFQLDIPGSSVVAAAAAGVRGSAEVLVSDRDLRAILPLVKSHEILNTAPLTGISQKIPVRVLAIEAGGTVLDVTKQAGCETPNAQIVQVSDGCDFLFVGGKETQGALGVKVEFWLERLRASLSLSLWVPLLPLRIEVSDTNLQRLQGSGLVSTSLEDDGGERKTSSDRRSQSCRPLYQRARVRFLAYFVAHSLDGSRQLTYLLGTDWLLDVSPLIRSQAVIRDPHIARLEEEGSILIGQEPGVTSVEVRSPVSHSILGEQTVLVSLETVSVLELRSNLMWGVNLSVSTAEIKHPGVFSVLCQSNNLEMIPKQESALSLWFLFSDFSTAPVNIYDPLDLTVMVVSSDPSVLSVRRPLMNGNSWSLPVLVFENAGQLPLLRFSILLPERCQEEESSGVLTAGYVRVTFPSNRTEGGEHQSSDIIQSDSDLITKDGEMISSANNIIPGTNDIIIRSDDIRHEDDDSISGADDIITTRWGIPGLEEGLYGLLAIFSLLTLLFLLSCVAFIMRHRKKSPPEGPGNPEAPNWVWLEGQEVDSQRNQGGGNVREEEEDENEQWEGRERGPQSLTSTFHPVRSSHDPETSICPPSDPCSFSTPTSLSRALLEAKRPEVMSFQTATTNGSEKRGDRVPDDPSVRSILVASEEDIMWVCKDMGIREPQEIRSYMEKIRGETPPQSDRRREGPWGRGIEVTGASVRRLT
ncbi:transmembrane protein 132A isoform X2 [Xenopus tropicalis]|uniref:Transmembrane protein 132A isoform X2 n=1 Tax=Xenopus tropicalis TaxID=8364 RepID=A0A8J1JWS4_XENTR|nr:transmembrane protein 132A isoform X2 [Xenopus tropicalis]